MSSCYSFLEYNFSAILFVGNVYRVLSFCFAKVNKKLGNIQSFQFSFAKVNKKLGNIQSFQFTEIVTGPAPAMGPQNQPMEDQNGTQSSILDPISAHLSTVIFNISSEKNSLHERLHVTISNRSFSWPEHCHNY